ncbi:MULTISPECIES: serine/threonine-protein kinase [Tsukamurella]|uniref:non-specific serine/threonine protein kinase n=2 Tax=Tsukamurella TaxID=2060 RepID=A0A5C5S293_9ACTN|nr:MULTISPECIES: serine/threonine-protein kinase [Tsukamurella]NMD57602.1 serine/threonine-protein kinase [Tsukamurella columbiensis]TWS29022.1 serine/threonine-protein kinase [Tsukamurella conjunctivitidis]
MRTQLPTSPLHRIGDYSVVRRLGAGGMGEVYLARHPRLPRLDAVKVLRAAASPSAPDALARFDQEAGLMARLTHPNIVAVYDRGRIGGRPWIAMEFVAGPTTGELQRRGPLPPDDVVAVVRAVASALDYAWTEHRVVHRDIKPDNILVTLAGGVRGVKVADFGVAKALDRPAGITAAGMTLGTLGYAAPEVLTGEGCDNRSDLYSLAATATALLTGVQVFRGDRSTVLSAQLTGRFATPTVRGTPLPAAVETVLRRGLSPAPSDRYPFAAVFADELGRAFRAGVTPPPPKPVTAPGPAPAPAPAPAPTARVPTPRARIRRRRIAVVGGAVVCALILGAGVVTASIHGSRTDRATGGTAATAPAQSTPTSARTVPDFRGLTLNEVSARADESGVDFTIDGTAPAEGGVVTTQDPAPNTAGYDGVIRLDFS